MRSSALRSLLPPLFATVLAACGGGAPPPAPTAPAVPSAVARASDAPDLSPVAEPANLLAVGRIGQPEKILTTVGVWSGLPLPGPNELVRSITDDAVAAAVDLSQPIDGAVVLSGSRSAPTPLYAFSVGVRSFEEAKATLGQQHRLTPRANGALEVHGVGQAAAIGGESDDDDDDEEMSCVLAPASPGARLVCGEPGALESLVPYLTRTLPGKTFPSNLHVELRFAPVRGPVADLRNQLPILARGLLNSQSQAIREIVDAAIGELADMVGDTSMISLDGDIAESGIKATLRVDYRSDKSAIAQLATRSVDRAGPVPPAFWHAPEDTDVAFFGKGTDPKVLDHARELFSNVLVEAFADQGMPGPEREEIKSLIAARMMPLLTGPVVYAKGYDAAAVGQAIAARAAVKEGDSAGSDRAEVALGAQILGWHLVQVAEPISNVGPILKDWATLFKKPAFAAWAKKQASAKMLARLRIAPPPAGATLPKDSVHLEVTVPRDDLLETQVNGKAKKLARKPIVVHVLAVPDAGATWLAVGLDPKLLATKTAAALSSAPSDKTLGKAKGLEALHDAAKLNGALTLTLHGLTVFTAAKRSGGAFSRVAALPDKGMTPIVVTFTAQGPSDKPEAKAGSASASVDVRREVITDVARLAMGLP